MVGLHVLRSHCDFGLAHAPGFAPVLINRLAVDEIVDPGLVVEYRYNCGRLKRNQVKAGMLTPCRLPATQGASSLAGHIQQLRMIGLEPQETFEMKWPQVFEGTTSYNLI